VATVPAARAPPMLYGEHRENYKVPRPKKKDLQ
jgi:hypothetical protein